MIIDDVITHMSDKLQDLNEPEWNSPIVKEYFDRSLALINRAFGLKGLVEDNLDDVNRWFHELDIQVSNLKWSCSRKLDIKDHNCMIAELSNIEVDSVKYEFEMASRFLEKVIGVGRFYLMGLDIGIPLEF